MIGFIAKYPKVFSSGIKGFMNQALTPRLFALMNEYTIKSKIANRLPWKKTGSTVAGFPVEFLLAFNVFPIYPEVYAIYAGSAGVTQPLIEHAESMGYSRDLCSYMKTSIGAYERKYPCDFGGAPKPDFYLSTNMICDTHVKWIENEARRHGVPYFGLDVPSYVSGSNEERLENYIDYVVAQFYDLIKFLEARTGKSFSERKFMETVNKSQEACLLYHEIYKYRSMLPAPQYFEFQRLFMLPTGVMWNLDGCIKYYQRHLKKIKEKYDEAPPEKLGAREKFRVMWEGITIWYNVDLYYDLARQGAKVVYESYTDSVAFRRKRTSTLPETLRQMAKEIIITPYTLNLENRIAFFEQKIDEYKIDGLILHANLSCRPSSTGLLDLKEAIQKSKKIPVLILNADMDDPRSFAEGPTQTRLDSFIEMMEENQQD